MDRLIGRLALALAAGCMIGAYLLLKPYYDAEQSLKGLRINAVEDAAAMSEGEEPNRDKEGYLSRDIDFEALKSVNPDIVGWIFIPGTPVDYPMLKNPYDLFYLDHDYERKRSAAGSIFLRAHEQEDFGKRNTIIYGHNLSGGKMFSWLTGYKSQEAYEAHAEIYIYLPQKAIKCTVYSSYECPDMSEAYKESFRSPEEWEMWLDQTSQQSSIKGPDPAGEDFIVTLSTCTDRGGKRRVVHAIQEDVVYKGE